MMSPPPHRPRAISLAAVFLLLACHGPGGEDSAAAARADSSAAGYAVGGSAAARPESALVTGRESIRRDSVRRDSVRRDSTRRDSVTRATRVAARRDSARAAATARRDTARTVASARRDTAHAAPRHDTTRAAPPAPAGPVHVNEFLTYDARSRTASVQLVAGYNGVNGSLNYNGVIRGRRIIAIPVGWHVHVTVTNRDSDLQHSAIVVDAVLPPPLELTTPAFPGAALPRLDEGLHEDETGTMDFTASHAGRYMLACGVPGHAQSGMWLQLVVSAGVSVPAYR